MTTEARAQGETNQSPPVGLPVYCGLALAWLLAAYLSGQYLAKFQLWGVVLAALLAATPIALSGAYTGTIAQLRSVSILRPSSSLYRLMSGRLLRSVFWVAWALASSLFMLLQFCMNSALEWAVLALAVPVFWLAYSLFLPFFSRHLRSRYLVTGMSLAYARALCSVLMLICYAVLAWKFVELQGSGSLSEALAARRANLPERAGSSMVQVGLQLMTLKDGIGGHYGGQLDIRLHIVMSVIGSFVMLFNWAATLSCFAIHPTEYRRVFGPLSDDDVPRPVAGARIAVASAVVLLVVAFIYVPSIAKLEHVLQLHEVEKAISRLESKVERIDESYFQPGTVDKIETARARALGAVGYGLARLEGQVDRAFDRMELSVDSYLDWYYSLPAEYMRIGKLLAGEIQSYMAVELETRLKQNEAFKTIDTAIGEALSNHESVIAEYRRDVRGILDANKIDTDEHRSTVVRVATLSDVIALPAHIDALDLKGRIGGSAVAAGTASVVAAAVTKKVIGKGIFKAAAQALGKIVATKAAGTTVGMLAGGTLGSVIPGAGTVAGALIGGAIGGLVVGVTVDAVILKLEETISRESFKQEILAAIRESRREFKGKLLPAK